VIHLGHGFRHFTFTTSTGHRETVSVYPCVVQADRACWNVVVPEALGRVEDVLLAMAEISSHMREQVLEVGKVRLVGEPHA